MSTHQAKDKPDIFGKPDSVEVEGDDLEFIMKHVPLSSVMLTLIAPTSRLCLELGHSQKSTRTPHPHQE